MIRHPIIALMLAACLSSQASADTNAPWQSLKYERHSVWLSVTAKFGLTPKDDYWLMTVDTSVGKNNEEKVELLFQDLSAQIVDKRRYSRGRKDQRFKSFDYRGENILRVRKDPLDSEARLAVEKWTQVTQQKIAFPELPDGAVLSTPYSILLAATDPTLANSGADKSLVIHTDYNFYKVILSNVGDEPVEVNYQLTGGNDGGGSINKTINANKIKISAEPLSEPARPDFEVMGLEGDIYLLIDPDTRLPLRIQGKAPRAGQTHLDLSEAQL